MLPPDQLAASLPNKTEFIFAKSHKPATLILGYSLMGIQRKPYK